MVVYPYIVVSMYLVFTNDSESNNQQPLQGIHDKFDDIQGRRLASFHKICKHSSNAFMEGLYNGSQYAGG